MTQPIRFILALHDHQPVGNFDGVFEQAYAESYKPFLDLFEPYSELKLGLHTSGPLMEWLEARQPDYLERLRALVRAGRVEIIGGAFYEPILSMIPPRDRVGQIRTYSRWLEERFGCRVRGMWVAERVWEQNITSDLVRAGIEYTMLDDSHFKTAGLNEGDLHGYYLTEDNGNLLAVFPDSEPLRYMIPFKPVEEVIDYLRGLHAARPGAIAFFGDDGEKFGAWPQTHQHCYNDGWLRRFFDQLVAHRDWIQPALPSEVLDDTPPQGTIYIPEGSYREMTEWVLPAGQQTDLITARRALQDDPRWPKLQRFVRGGFWRNFKTKYPETNEMYARMLLVSRRLEAAEEAGQHSELLDDARSCLYRGQCNCGYWHGAFGGVYLPHLRNAVYQQLIAADNLLDRAQRRDQRPWVELTSGDFNFDGRQEVLLSNNRLLALVAPARGGQMYELDVRAICHNLLATLARRPEAYHRQVLAGAGGANDVAGVAEQVIFKQPGLDARLQYDAHARKSLLDHFFAHDATLEAAARGEAAELGDFLSRPFEARLLRNPDRMRLQMSAQGQADGAAVTITKAVTLDAGSNLLEIGYLLEGLPTDRLVHFGCEFNFAGMPSGIDDRYFHQAQRRLGQLGAQLDLHDQRELSLCDQWLGIDVRLGLSRPSGIWTYPIETVSQSEGGYELVHQSVVVTPHWLVRGDAEGRWSVTMELSIDTSLAERRMRPATAAAALV